MNFVYVPKNATDHLDDEGDTAKPAQELCRHLRWLESCPGFLQHNFVTLRILEPGSTLRNFKFVQKIDAGDEKQYCLRGLNFLTNKNYC